MGKREMERDHLGLFLSAYKQVTGETFELSDAETPDFIGRDAEGRTVGIEMTQLRFAPDVRAIRRAFEEHDRGDVGNPYWELLELGHQKTSKLTKGLWPECERKILVIMLVDCGLDEVRHYFDTDTPDGRGFDEVWLADHTLVEPFGGVDLYPLVHATLEGLFDVSSRDKKPYG